MKYDFSAMCVAFALGLLAVAAPSEAAIYTYKGNALDGYVWPNGSMADPIFTNHVALTLDDHLADGTYTLTDDTVSFYTVDVKDVYSSRKGQPIELYGYLTIVDGQVDDWLVRFSRTSRTDDSYEYLEIWTDRNFDNFYWYRGQILPGGFTRRLSIYTGDNIDMPGTWSVTAVPEPATSSLVIGALTLLGLRARQGTRNVGRLVSEA